MQDKKYQEAYLNAQTLFENAKYEDAAKEFEKLSDYKDSKEKINHYHNLLQETKDRIEREKKEKQEKERLAEIERKNKLKKMKDSFVKSLKILIPSVLVISILLILTFTLFIPLGKYNNALKLIEEGKYIEAKEILNDLGDFNSANKQIKLMDARTYFAKLDYETGIDVVCEVGGEVNVTYNTDGGTTDKLSETINKTLNRPNYIDNQCEKVGYTFTGWTVESYSFYDENYKVDLKLKATYKLVVYNLSFQLNGGIQQGYYPSSYYVSSDDIYISDPTKAGYTFIGWTQGMTDSPVKNLVIPQGSVGHKIFTAHWQINNYYVVFDANGGTGSMSSLLMTYNQSNTLTTNTFTRDYCTFLCWNTKPDGSGISYSDGEIVRNITTDGTITLYAIWKQNTVTVVYHPNGADQILLVDYKISTDDVAYSIDYSNKSDTEINEALKEIYQYKLDRKYAYSYNPMIFSAYNEAAGNYNYQWGLTDGMNKHELYMTRTGYLWVNYWCAGNLGENVKIHQDVAQELANASGQTFNGIYLANKCGVGEEFKTSDVTVHLYAYWKPVEYNIKFNGIWRKNSSN